MSNDKDWKSKYFNNLKELEAMEKSWGKLEDILRKTISRVSITAKGIHPQLDKILSDIQQHTRNKKDYELEQDLENLAQALLKLEEQPASATPANSSAQENDISTPVNETSFALSFIEQLQLSPQYQVEFEQLQHTLPNLSPEKCLSELALLINRLLQIEASDTADKSESFQVLISLIEKIALTYGNTPELDKLAEQIEQADEDSDWREFLDLIINQIRIIIHGIHNEKLELEGLIVDVTQQLSEISSALNDDHLDSLQGRKETQKLQQVMDKSVQDIQQTVQSENDIQQLKSAISNNLVSIKTSLKEFVVHDSERFTKSEQRNQKLQQQIHFMEQESEQLKKKLNENRKKLMFDTLTGVRNRLSYDEILDQEISRYARYHETFSYAVLDIDHFKRINDEYGHNAGDKALQIVAQMMAKNIRKTDFLFRIGGEEFVLILPKTELDNAAPLVEKIRSAVGEANFHFKQQKLNITLSAGLSCMRESDTAETLYERTDKALYQAKNSGRNKLVVTTPE